MWLAVAAGLVTVLLTACGPVARLSLENSHWRAVSIGNLAPVEGHEPTLDFSADGISGSAGCNRYTTTMEIDPPHLQHGPFGIEGNVCDNKVMQIEIAFADALQQADAIDIGIGRLVLNGNGGTIVFEGVERSN